MKLLDVNVALYAYVPEATEHDRGRSWFEALLSGREPVLFPLATLLGFTRISTDIRVFREPFSVALALDIVESWLALPHVRIAEPGTDHWLILRRLAETGQTRGASLTDAHIAALAIEHGADLCTTDRGFARFAELRTINPLLD